MGLSLTIGIQGVNGKVAKIVVDFEHYIIEFYFFDNLIHLLGDCHAFLA
jgi:hypothetical protein